MTFRFMPTRMISILQKYQHFYAGFLKATTVFRRDPAGEHDQACAAYLMIVTGLRIQASWVMCIIDCGSMIPMEFQVNIA